MKNKIIEISNLNISLQNKKILKNIFFYLKKGETVGVIGESGSGKTTLGKAILGLVKKESGEISIKTEKNKKIQMIFQNPYSSLDPKMNILKIVTLGMIVNGLYKKREKERAIELLEMCGLSKDYMYRYPCELSGGEKQRVAIAKTLSTDPEVLIADEPTSALDVTIQLKIIDLLNELKKKFNLSIIFISHDLKIIKKISDRVYIIFKGEILEAGETEDIFISPQTDYTKNLLNAIPIKHPIGRKRSKQ